MSFEKWDPEFGKNVVRMTIASNAPANLANDIRRGLKDMNYISLEYDIVDKGMCSNNYRIYTWPFA